MSKPSIVRLFWSSLVAFAGALVLFFVAVGLVYASGGFVVDGPDVSGSSPRRSAGR